MEFINNQLNTLILVFLNSKETKRVYDSAITMVESATKIRSTVQLPELPVKRIGLKTNIDLVHKLNSIHNSHNVIPVKPFYHQDVKNLGKWNEDSDFVYLFDMEH